MFSRKVQHYGIFTKVQTQPLYNKYIYNDPQFTDYKCSFGLSQTASSPRSYEKDLVVSLGWSGFQNMYQMASKHRPKSPFLSIYYEDVGGKVKISIFLLQTFNFHGLGTTSFLSIFPGRNGRQYFLGSVICCILSTKQLYWVWNMF